jgi:glycerophosphoryl diester phosphodiesterase
MDLARELGVDAVITDHPDEMMRKLGRDVPTP